ncbi:MAG: acylphosphatase [Candidatus Omnitrophota bacterium]
MKRKCAHIFYSGRVQGVGFRYTAERIAEAAGIGGWVRNLPDGRVELLAEAEETKLKNFINALETALNRYIGQKDIAWENPEGNQGFKIRY